MKKLMPLNYALFLLIIGLFSAIYSFEVCAVENDHNKSPLIKIVQTLCADSAQLMDDAVLIDKDLEKYFEKYKKEFYERGGVSDPSELTQWIALIYALERHHCLIIADWKDQGSNFSWLLDQLPQSKKLKLNWNKISAIGDEYHPTADYAPLAEKILEPLGLVLVMLDIDSDCFPLCIIHRDQLVEMQKYAEALSGKVHIFDKNAGQYV